MSKPTGTKHYVYLYQITRLVDSSRDRPDAHTRGRQNLVKPRTPHHQKHQEHHHHIPNEHIQYFLHVYYSLEVTETGRPGQGFPVELSKESSKCQIALRLSDSCRQNKKGVKLSPRVWKRTRIVQQYEVYRFGVCRSMVQGQAGPLRVQGQQAARS